LNFKLPADAPTIETIRLQRAKVQEAQRLNRLLTAESSKNTAIINRLRSLRGLPPKSVPETSKAPGSSEPSTNDTAYPVFAHLENKADLADGTGDTPLSTNAAFVLSQLPALKSLLAELKPQERLLGERKKANPNIAEGQGEKTWRKQRVEYIETQTRRHLEKVVGLELGKNGEVGDGEWQAEGRKLAKGEVQDLEKMVEMIGGGSSEGKDEKMTDV
jgi:kinetochore protein Mis12/MTW1